MRQQRYEMVLRRRLGEKARNPPVENDWADDDHEEHGQRGQ
jgi:hypothetical protein